ncbi:LacI family DNA-binding transcriptional regulator [Streptomyces sp. NPDC051940]|uniref:LacI family DNA-binding transcriptional regulator n=1 Tax=Streptomyces sp. NPDC051940 TaxID=3155675 RepID=UPI003416DBBC
MADAVHRPSQRDIARLAGVSQAAVSMVVNGKADENGIAESTQRKVREAMRELGYVSNVAGRALRGGRNGLIGVHTFERVFPVGPEDYYHEFLVGIEEGAVGAGQDLVLFASTQRPDGTRTIYGNGTNRLRLADGSVILGLERNDEELERLEREGYPFVFIGRRDVPGVRATYVAADYATAVVQVMDALTALGHSRIRYLGCDVRRSPRQERLDGYTEYAERTGLRPPPPSLLPDEAVTPGWLRGLLAEGTTALLVETPELAAVLARAAAGAGVSVPDELTVVGLELPPAAEPTAGWSHIAVPRREMGATAVSLLLRLLDGQVPPGHHEVLSCTPLTPGTLAPPRTT